MRGASSESLATLTDALGASVGQGADGARVADDLFAVGALLGGQPGLRRVLTDLSVTAVGKAGLAREVFGTEVSEAAMDLLAKAVGLRWAATRDLGYAIEQLAVISVVKGAEQAGQEDALEEDLFAVARLVADNPALGDALADPGRSVQDKAGLLRGLLDGKVTAPAVRLAEAAVAGTHRSVVVALEQYQKVAAAHRDRLVAEVHVAKPLSEADHSRLSAALVAQYHRPVHLNVLVDPEVIGGMRVEIGDDVIDGTVASKLDDARRRLAG